MDGVTDAAFRYMVDTIGHPSVLFTEFTSVEGIMHGVVKLLSAFTYHKTRTPTVAQIFGSHPEDFYAATFAVCEMGFDGVDINMGCPDRSVALKGGGAGLILKPKTAQKIVTATKKAVADWIKGKKIEDTGLPEEVIRYVKEYKKRFQINKLRQLIPVTVKTRIGYDHAVTEDWISNLLEIEPVAISIHGRTLRQMYTGFADWDEIGKAARLIRKTQTLVLGNGDVKSVEDGRKKSKEYGLDGVLIGRAAFGNPWLFDEKIPSRLERISAAIKQCEHFMELTPEGHFLSLRKHLAWYMKGFEGSHELRARLMAVKTLDDVKQIFSA